MRVAVSGASGLVGSALVPALEDGGHEVLRLVRREPVGAHEVGWDPAGGTVDAAALEGVDAVVHLAGESIDRRWTAKRKDQIVVSRVRSTRLLAETVAELSPRPALVCASGVHYYGTSGDAVADESSPRGDGFLAGVVAAWEESAQPARDAGARVAHLRSALVLSRRGGALPRLVTPFRLGLGGRVGSGRQWWSWISLSDLVSAYRHAVEGDLEGPANASAPGAVRNEEFVKALGSVLHRPTVLPLPAFAVRMAFGQMGEELLLGGRRVAPHVLERRGFTFAHPTLDGALAHELG
jgi:uncharacterized protein (TIGR01777 family)